MKSQLPGLYSKEISKIWFELKDKNGPTEFVGYNNEKAEGKIIEIIVKDKPVKELLENQLIKRSLQYF